MKVAAAYIRVSTEDQTELSPESQVKMIRDYAKAHDMVLPEEYIFQDAGISGKHTKKRTEFNRMIGIAKTKPKPFEVILLWKFSRFARNREDSVVYKSMLRKQLGIDVISITENLGDDKMSILIEALIEAMDEYYSINLAEEVKRGMTEKATRGGVVSVAPFGYRNQNGTLVPDPENSEGVRRIFQQFLDGSPYRTIASEMNNLGYRFRRGGRFEARTVKYILLNPVYIGKIRWDPSNNGGWFNTETETTILSSGTHEPLIDQETWEKTQKKIKEIEYRYKKYERQPSDGDYMLKGLVRCSNCGATLVKSGQKSMQCNAYAKGKCTVSHGIQMERINETVISAIESMLKSGDFVLVERKKKVFNPSGSIAERIKAEQKKLERVKEAYASGVDSLEEYRYNKSQIMKTIQSLEASRKPEKKLSEEEEKKRFIKKHLESVKKLRSKAISDADKNSLLKAFVDSIVYEKRTETLRLTFFK